MKTSRQDIIRDNRKVFLPNSRCLGYSSNTLKSGDLFSYKEFYTDGAFHYRTAMSHGRVRPNTEKSWYILAQAANDMFSFTYERWIDPKDVVEMIPGNRINANIKRFFMEASV